MAERKSIKMMHWDENGCVGSGLNRYIPWWSLWMENGIQLTFSVP